jgi:hypothetical protein
VPLRNVAVALLAAGPLTVLAGIAVFLWGVGALAPPPSRWPFLDVPTSGLLLDLVGLALLGASAAVASRLPRPRRLAALAAGLLLALLGAQAIVASVLVLAWFGLAAPGVAAGLALTAAGGAFLVKASAA